MSLIQGCPLRGVPLYLCSLRLDVSVCQKQVRKSQSSTDSLCHACVGVIVEGRAGASDIVEHVVMSV